MAIKDRNGAAKAAVTFDARVICPIAVSSILRV
jgi:hypothetical protein